MTPQVRCRNEKCGCVFDPARGTKASSSASCGLPWPAQYDLRLANCPSCQTLHAVCQRSFEPPGRGEVWLWREEALEVGADYEYIRRNPAFGLMLGTQPLELFWWYWPAEAPKSVLERVEQAVRATGRFRRNVLRLCVTRGDQDPSFWAARTDLFDAVATLRPHVYADAVGPYPSLRAERSLIQTFGLMRLRQVAHVWPAVGLKPEHRLTAGFDESEFTKAWSDHARRDVPIEVD